MNQKISKKFVREDKVNYQKLINTANNDFFSKD